jgi:hypothetical protein
MTPRHCWFPWLLALLCSIAPSQARAENRTLPLETFRDRLRGGWAGQMIGVSYGSVYEFQSNGKPITTPLREWKPDFIANSINQDDIYVEMTFLKTLTVHGLAATREQAGADFRDSKYRLWHANMAARENLKQGIMPPRSGHPRYNPHADDIDFQIEADLFGLVTPGMPAAGLKLADLFGSIMNWGDGLYGGRFVTAMYCRAYLEPEPTAAAVRRCLEAGLAAMPAESDYAKTIRDTIAGYEAHPDDWLKTWQLLEQKWARDDLCPEGENQPFNIDAKLNGAYIALGLLYGGGDFAKTLEITTRCGQDADCNPSNAAGILGTILGYRRIPAAFTAGIPTLTGQKFEYTDYDYPGLIAACEELARRILAENGGRVVSRNGEELLEFPDQQPTPPATLEQMRDFGREQLHEWRADFDRRLRAARAQALQETLAGWAPGWRVAAMGDAMPTGVMPALGRPRVLVTHPVSRQEPAAIERRLRLPAARPRLALTVASYPDRPAADWELRVLVDGQIVQKRVIRRPGEWEEVNVDLAVYAGKEVTLRLENAAGGENNWAWEAAYWARADVLDD